MSKSSRCHQGWTELKLFARFSKCPKTNSLYQVTAYQSVISVVSHFCSEISFKYDTIFDTSKLTQTARTAQKTIKQKSQLC
jgi:hypothetical protein